MRFRNESLSKTATLSLIGLALMLLHPLSNAEPLFPLTVQLDWLENAQFAGLLVAKEKGWYAEQGLDVTIVPINRTTLDTVGPVVKGRNVIGCADGMILLQARRDTSTDPGICRYITGFPVRHHYSSQQRPQPGQGSRRKNHRSPRL